MASFSPLIVCVAVFVCGVVSQTQPPERGEQGDLRFNYDPESQYMVLTTHSTCYMVKLTHAERDHVHTSHGIEDLELSFMRYWLGVLPETKIYHDDRFLTTNVQKWCERHDIYFLDRSSLQSTTMNSILG